MNAAHLVFRWQLRPVKWMHVIWRDTVKRLAIGSLKSDRAVIKHMNHDAALVHHAMVEATE